jgi:hypothetical protein
MYSINSYGKPMMGGIPIQKNPNHIARCKAFYYGGCVGSRMMG